MIIKYKLHKNRKYPIISWYYDSDNDKWILNSFGSIEHMKEMFGNHHTYIEEFDE